ncbi:MAG: hypothetical protein GY729_04500 [Desulfobacteraceae bacterium]|nr:hypothetical protein [Desulfobacteraceae bacterium]
MNIIITMAGKGTRFKNAGYLKPKFQIEVCGQTLFSWAMKSLDNLIQSGSFVYFICRKEDAASDFIHTKCKKLGVNDYFLLELNQTTDGQATTALLAKKMIQDSSIPIAIYNIDTYVEADYLRPKDIKGDGWIPCFPGPGSHWSFAKTNADGKVVKVREKQRISEHATIGLYWFSSFDLYELNYKDYYRNSANIEKGEKYIAPIYNQLIRNDHDVYIQQVPLKGVHGLGTPEEVKIFKDQFS